MKVNILKRLTAILIIFSMLLPAHAFGETGENSGELPAGGDTEPLGILLLDDDSPLETKFLWKNIEVTGNDDIPVSFDEYYYVAVKVPENTENLKLKWKDGILDSGDNYRVNSADYTLDPSNQFFPYKYKFSMGYMYVDPTLAMMGLNFPEKFLHIDFEEKDVSEMDNYKNPDGTWKLPLEKLITSNEKLPEIDGSYIWEKEQKHAYVGMEYSKKDSPSHIYYNYILIIGGEFPGSETEEDKTELKNAIAKVWDDSLNGGAGGYSGNYYTENDRFNGKEISENGFWKDMEFVLSFAKDICANPNASKVDIARATSNLNDAISKLIPTDRINPTALYENIEKNKKLCWTGDFDKAEFKAVPYSATAVNVVSEENTSPETYKAYKDALNEGEQLISSLFDDNGEPTDENKAKNSQNAEAAIDKIETAIRNLDAQLRHEGELVLSHVELFKRSISMFAEKYDPANFPEGKYSTDSVSELTEKRNNALPFVEKNYEKSILVKEYIALYRAFFELKNACYSLVDGNKEEIRVRLSTTSPVSLYDGVDYPDTVTKTLTLPKGSSLKELIEREAGSLIEFNNLRRTTLDDRYAGLKIDVPMNNLLFDNLLIYVNDELYVFNYESASDGQVGIVLSSHAFESVKLRDGDEILLCLAPMRVESLSSQSGLEEQIFRNIADSMMYQRIEAPERVKPGEEFEITVTSDGATALNYLEKNTPVKGGDVYIGGAKADKEEAGKQPINIPMYEKTDNMGKAKLTLYSEGWQALNVFHPESNGSEINGMTVMIYVEPAADIGGIKKQLTKELTDRYEDINYPKEYFSDEDWNSIVSLFETGINGIKDATTSGEAREKEFASLQGIIELQKKADKNNNTNLTAFKNILSSLPDEAEKLDESAKFPIERLKLFREKMTEWQIGKLTPVEEAKYQAVIEEFEKGLKPAVSYSLSIEEDYSDIPEGDRETLKKMVKWLKDNTANEDKSGDVGGNKLAELFSINEIKSGNDYNYSRIYEKLDKAPAFKRVAAIISPDYSAYFHLRDNGGKIEADDKSWEINDDNGKFKAVSTGLMTLGSYTVGKAKYLINGRQYKVKEIEAEGLEKKNPDLSDAVQFDYKKVYQNVNLAFTNSKVDFEMPYRDVKIIVKWAPVGTDVVSEKQAAKEAVEAAYSAYDKSLYSENNWAALTSAKTEGLTAIENASDYEEVVNLRKETIAKMASVRTKVQEEMAAPGSPTPVPDFGKPVGRVRIIVENQTFKEATKATKNREPAWHGTLIDGWYELCERDTMMTAVLKALRLKNCRWSTGSQGSVTEWDGYGINYLSGILVPKETKGDGADYKWLKDERLAEFSGETGSGWMGTLNDWFTNFGFQEFGVENGELHNGDEIRIQYTQNLGVDLSGTWGNSDTSLKALEITGGKLLPVFDGKALEYQLVIPGERSVLHVTPTAANKNYLTKIFLNSYDTDSAFYSRTENIPVKSGDILYVGVGEKSWPSMNKQGAEAREYSGTKYTVRVFGNDKAGVKSRIEALPNPEEISIRNYALWDEIVNSLKNDYEALSDKSGLDGDKLKNVADKVKFWAEVDDAKTKLAALPYIKSPKSEQALKYMNAINAAKAAYSKLNDEQKEHITVGDAANYNALAKALGMALIAGTPDKPEVETSKSGTTTAKTEVEVSGAVATVTLKDANAAEMLKQAKENKSAEIVLDAKADEADADKVKVELPKKVADSIINDTKADLTVKLPEAELKISQAALKEIASQSKGDKLAIEVVKVKKPAEEQKKLTGESAEVFALTVKSGDSAIHNFGAGKVTIRKLIPERLKEKKVAAVYIPEKGELEVMSGKRVIVDKKNWYEFTTSHFSDFALVDADEAGIEVEEAMTDDEVKAMVKELKLRATTKALKKSVRVTVKADKETLMNLKDNGYTVKYKYYRAVKKNGRYKLISTMKTSRYTDKKVKRGKSYYYKARLAVYDDEGRLIATTSLRNCKASKRQLKAA